MKQMNLPHLSSELLKCRECVSCAFEGRKLIFVGPAHDINGYITACKSELELGIFVSIGRRKYIMKHAK